MTARTDRTRTGPLQPGDPLPAGWRWARLSDVCSTGSGGTPSKVKLL